jgi:hypothetical protein
MQEGVRKPGKRGVADGLKAATISNGKICA